MKLLVTGGAGYIGGIVAVKLAAAGHSVTVADNLSTGYPDVVTDQMALVRLDIHNIATVLTLEAGFDGVLHFAARIAAGESVQRPELYWEHQCGGIAGSARCNSPDRCAAACLQLHRGRLRQPGPCPYPRGRDDGTDEPIRLDQARRRHGDSPRMRRPRPRRS
jgi:hypothetical protein